MELLLKSKARCYLQRLKHIHHKTLLSLKILSILLTAASLQISATSVSQRISLSLKNEPIQNLFTVIEQQTNFSFVYSKEAIEQSKPVTIEAKGKELRDILKDVFAKQPLSYAFEEKFIIIKIDETKSRTDPAREIKGRVVNENGEPIPGATVASQKTSKGTSTNDAGEFSLNDIDDNDKLVITSVGYFKEEVSPGTQSYLIIRLKIAAGKLDEAIVMAYGQTTRRLNTGNISKVSSEEISKQPVSNPLAAIEGRVPGLFITQTSGVPGAAFTVEIRGRSSLDMNLSRNDPLFIIDGVPFEPGNAVSNQIVSAANKPGSTNLGGLSPLNILNTQDIESIEVLKDADATSIYGSRGANGVVLITTKKGKTGKAKFTFNLSRGWSTVSRTMDLLNTPEYLKMRREAFANDGYVPQVSVPFGNGYAPDLLTLDTTIYTDFKKILIGGTAKVSNADLSFSGGSDNTLFLLGGSYRNETNIFSDDLHDRRTSVHFNLDHKSANKKFEIIFSGLFSNEKNKLIQTDLTRFINLPPNFVLYDAAGKPAWTQNGVPINYINLNFSSIPSAELLKGYSQESENLLGSMQLNYTILRNLQFRLNSGYNKFTSDEVSTFPKASLNPQSSQLAFSKFGNASSINWNIDPQLEFSHTINKTKIILLMGSTFLERTTKSQFINANNYTSDLLLNSLAAAGQIIGTNIFSQYKYNAVFGRVNYNQDNKYIFNLTARRDGSSRFGPGRRSSNFGAIGGAWIFSNESFFKKIHFISFGKIRSSYGITGNDQIGNYKYFDLWNPLSTTYQQIPSLQPSSLFNPDYEWEKNKKFEVAIEIGLLKDRILFSASYFRNRSSNQLISYQLPDQTGFTSITRNLPALVQNSGAEFLLTTKILSGKNLTWISSFNLTLSRNKLISFPGLASSSYYLLYKEGESLSIINKAKFLGVDPATGIYTVEDHNKDGVLSFPDDFQFLGNTDPKFYGGFQNSIDHKNFNLSFFFEFRKKTGNNYLAYVNQTPPGSAINQPKIVLDRWQHPGDNTAIQKYTALQYGTTASTGSTNFYYSDGVYSDASYIRLKNVSLSYFIPPALFKKIKVESSQIYVRAQNVFLITKYKGSDPETQDINVLPPLKTFVAGIQFTF